MPILKAFSVRTAINFTEIRDFEQKFVLAWSYDEVKYKAILFFKRIFSIFIGLLKIKTMEGKHEKAIVNQHLSRDSNAASRSM